MVFTLLISVFPQSLVQSPILSAFSDWCVCVWVEGGASPAPDKEKDFFLFSMFLEKSRKQFCSFIILLFKVPTLCHG